MSSFCQPVSRLVRKKAFLIQREYRAAIARSLGQPLIVEDISALEKVEDTEVIVNVEACGINASDILKCQGEYTEKQKLPFIPGFEVCGTVKQVGVKVEDFKPGDRVIGLNKEKLGGFAEECALDQSDVWPISKKVSFEEGAALLDTYATALLCLHRRAKITAKDTVLITAAAGGLGLAAVDLAANVYKAKVIGVCDTEEKASIVRDKGAFAALKFDPKHLRDKIKDYTGKKGIKIILDAVGGDLFKEALKYVTHEGKVIVAGFASRQIPQIMTSDLLPKSYSLIGVSLTHYRLADREVYRLYFFFALMFKYFKEIFSAFFLSFFLFCCK
ncbi:hypothetical protein QYM36_002840 [Artemia franciscana]|uniref:Enoyl reductase (ER) domain-containing protein n=1 Tax=Artemia franciscana TaxID=6661 RepID=A0AA88I8S1_ARTSF|nr:hypothetical protein QYM36_002840 [Artemia franciscana]